MIKCLNSVCYIVKQQKQKNWKNHGIFVGMRAKRISYTQRCLKTQQTNNQTKKKTENINAHTPPMKTQRWRKGERERDPNNFTCSMPRQNNKNPFKERDSFRFYARKKISREIVRDQQAEKTTRNKRSTDSFIQPKDGKMTETTSMTGDDGELRLVQQKCLMRKWYLCMRTIRYVQPNRPLSIGRYLSRSFIFFLQLSRLFSVFYFAEPFDSVFSYIWNACCFWLWLFFRC